ncbi:hypothetical protein THOB06_30158 [Vibrio rotiferianus]|nr:hypothetical protein THOG10_30158 [Vibrio rotiferianus]CAH1582830.1 hypothetical protein THOB06_30158 [Vibrio rotiferianus]
MSTYRRPLVLLFQCQLILGRKQVVPILVLIPNGKYIWWAWLSLKSSYHEVHLDLT